jgi:hypothetical protein
LVLRTAVTGAFVRTACVSTVTVGVPTAVAAFVTTTIASWLTWGCYRWFVGCWLVVCLLIVVHTYSFCY